MGTQPSDYSVFVKIVLVVFTYWLHTYFHWVDFLCFSMNCVAGLPVCWGYMDYIGSMVPTTWSGYRRAIRTNNDVEGWHRALNGAARTSSLELYKLICLLGKQAKLVSVQVRLVSDSKLARHQRRKYRRVYGRLQQLWDQLDNKEKTPKEVLRACSHLCTGPWKLNSLIQPLQVRIVCVCTYKTWTLLVQVYIHVCIKQNNKKKINFRPTDPTFFAHVIGNTRFFFWP